MATAATKGKSVKGVKMNTPVGVLVYPSLTAPNYGTQQYPDEEGSYRTNLRLIKNDEAVQAFLQKLDEVMELSKQQADEAFAHLPLKTRKSIQESQGGIKPKPIYQDVYDEATEEPTGEIELRIRKKASGKRKDGTKWQAPRLPLFDSASPPKLLPKTVEIWSGSKAIINLEAQPYFMNTGHYGVSLRLNAVQIHSLVSRGGSQNAADYGFEGGGGFDYDEAAFEEAVEQVLVQADEVDVEADF